MANKSLHRSMLWVCLVCPSLAGCGNALLYGEGTNISLATIKVNDNPATPVQLHTGLHRTVAAIVPRQNDGAEAMNLISGLHFTDTKQMFGTLTVETQFASGRAATEIADKNPSLAKSIMNIGK